MAVGRLALDPRVAVPRFNGSSGRGESAMCLSGNGRRCATQDHCIYPFIHSVAYGGRFVFFSFFLKQDGVLPRLDECHRCTVSIVAGLVSLRTVGLLCHGYIVTMCPNNCQQLVVNIQSIRVPCRLNSIPDFDRWMIRPWAMLHRCTIQRLFHVKHQLLRIYQNSER